VNIVIVVVLVLYGMAFVSRLKLTRVMDYDLD
jgi:hypothetical protein